MERPFGRGPTTLLIGDLRSPGLWKLRETTYPRPGIPFSKQPAPISKLRTMYPLTFQVFTNSWDRQAASSWILTSHPKATMDNPATWKTRDGKAVKLLVGPTCKLPWSTQRSCSGIRRSPKMCQEKGLRSPKKPITAHHSNRSTSENASGGCAIHPSAVLQITDVDETNGYSPKNWHK